VAPGVLRGATALCPPNGFAVPAHGWARLAHGWARLAHGWARLALNRHHRGGLPGEGMTVAKAAGIGLIIVGVVVLNTGGAH
jgi:hypothetical protein